MRCCYPGRTQTASVRHRRRRGRCLGTRSASRGSRSWRLADTTHERHVLLAVDQIRDGRSHASVRLGLKFEKLLAILGVVGDEASIRNNLKHQISSGREGAAEAGATAPKTRPTEATPAPRAAAAPTTARRRTPKRPSLTAATARHFTERIMRPCPSRFVPTSRQLVHRCSVHHDRRSCQEPTR